MNMNRFIEWGFIGLRLITWLPPDKVDKGTSPTEKSQGFQVKTRGSLAPSHDTIVRE
jgi:hypothetical protein